jgi:Tfp pilus assembly protein PilF
MSNLAIIYLNLGQFKAAEDLGIVLLKKRREVLGITHPNTFRAQKNLAVTYQYLGKLKEAEELKIMSV